MPSDFAEIAFLDRGNSVSRVKIYTPDVDGTALTTWQGVIDNVLTSGLLFLFQQITYDNIVGMHLVTKNVAFSATTPTDPAARNAFALRVVYQDNVTAQKYHLTIPAPILTTMEQAGSDWIDTADVAFSAWAAAFQTLARSPDGNAVTVLGARIVGRSR